MLQDKKQQKKGYDVATCCLKFIITLKNIFYCSFTKFTIYFFLSDQLEINQVEKSHLQLLQGDRRLVGQGGNHRTGAGEGLPHVMVVPADGPGR